jgi:hypothetical protein
MANKWLTHVKKTMRKMKSAGTYHKGDGLKKVIKVAKQSYHKGGYDSESDEESVGGRRRKHGGDEEEETAVGGRRRKRGGDDEPTGARRRKTQRRR